MMGLSASRTGKIMVGVRVDGTAVFAPVTLRPNEEVCTRCLGSGELTASPIDPSVRDYEVECDLCDGEGIVTTEAD